MAVCHSKSNNELERKLRRDVISTKGIKGNSSTLSVYAHLHSSLHSCPPFYSVVPYRGFVLHTHSLIASLAHGLANLYSYYSFIPSNQMLENFIFQSNYGTEVPCKCLCVERKCWIKRPSLMSQKKTELMYFNHTPEQ